MAEQPTTDQPRSRVRTVAAGALTVLACLLVWFALVAPNEISRLTPTAFVRIPVEGLVVVALVLVSRHRAKRTIAGLVGVGLALVTILKILDMGFFEALGRPFNPVFDRGYFGSAVGLLSDSIGRSRAVIVLILAAILALALCVLMPLAVLRLTRLIERHRRTSIRAATTLGVAWSLCAVLGVQLAAHTPVASSSAVSLAFDQVSQVRASLRDEREFKQAAGVDPLRDTAAKDLLTGLRGKDVIIAFVESYGRVAVQDSAFSPRVDAVLDAGTSRLRAAGFSAQSAFLTSPTFGGISWLAHSTLQSGLWINNQLRYDNLVASDRFTLSDAFKRAGWRTVDDVPSNTKDWPQGKSFYHYDKIYDARNVGYRVRSSATPPCPTSTSCRHSNARNSRTPTTRRSWRRSISCRAIPRGRPCRTWSTGATSVTAQSSTACPRRANRRRPCGASAVRCGPPTGNPSSTR